MEQLKTESVNEIILRAARLSEDELKKAVALSSLDRPKIMQKLVDADLISEEELHSILNREFGIPRISLKECGDLVPINGLSLKFMKEAKCVPFRLEENVLHVAVADPFDSYSLDAVKMATGFDLAVYLAKEKEIVEVAEQLYSNMAAMDRIVGDIEGEQPFTDMDQDVNSLRDMASEAPVIRLVNLIISKAVDSRASDIHLEPYENEFKVRYRIDGVLADVEAPPRRLSAALTSRIKIMAQLDIAERRLPQDGRIKIKAFGKDIDIRVSTIPTVFGESVVMRLLDRSNVVLTLEALGFPQEMLNTFHQLITKPYGMILVTGPTGSGKTTTLYAALQKIHSKEKKIITVEDPVEYQMNGVNQIQVRAHIGLTFSNCLRSVVRQDPDVILIGEIRDRETAEIAIHSALTGHLVFSTLHTNDTAGAITRLLEMGVEDYLLSSSIICILAQRLVRVICPHCKEPDITDLDEAIAKELGMKREEEATLFKGAGCPKCSFTGYSGRTGIYEQFLMNEEIRHLILNRSDASTLKKTAVNSGMIVLREDGWNKVKAGVTTVSEVLRVTMEE